MSLTDFLLPVNLPEITGDASYQQGQIGAMIDFYDELFPDIEQADILLVGCGELRGSGILNGDNPAPDLIRRQFYSLYYWHDSVRVADIGNIRQGATYKDSLAALQEVLKELNAMGKTTIILGGSHDLSLAQYHAGAVGGQLIEASVVDAMIDLNMESPFRSDNFLMEMFTQEPNHLRHYNHIGFQSYLVHPGILQTLDKLKFDFYRVGHVKDDIEEMEPAIRNSHLFAFDINAIAQAYAPANLLSPNGFNGEEACTLMQYAGLSTHVQTIGIYGYRPEKDQEELTARQISHMLWYVIDGRYRCSREAELSETDHFNEYQMAFSEIETAFLQSKKTGRWWMQLPDGQYIPCSYKDYLTAGKDEIPERWFRAQQR